MKCTAVLKTINMSHYKLNKLADLFRGLNANDAVLALMFCQKKGAYEMRKLILSCMSNAENNHGINKDSLYVEKIEVGKAFTLRRFMARGRGRSTRIEKFFSNLKITLSPRFADVNKK